jgi:AcrR family transcriptional regulator
MGSRSVKGQVRSDMSEAFRYIQERNDTANIDEMVLDALTELVAEYKFDDVSVGMICERVHISRQTFYRYYSNKYNVLEKFFAGVSKAYFSEIGSTLTWHEALTLPHRTAHRYLSLTRGVYESKYRYRYLEDCSRNMNDALLEALRRVGEHVTRELEFQLETWCWGAAGSIARWNHEGQPLTADELGTYLESTVPQELHAALDRKLS